MRYCLFLLMCLLCFGCAVPEDDAWRTVPVTNNPNMMNQRGDSAFPGVNL